MVPSLDHGGEGAADEWSGGWSSAYSGSVVAVDVGAPAGEGLQEREVRLENDQLQLLTN